MFRKTKSNLPAGPYTTIDVAAQIPNQPPPEDAKSEPEPTAQAPQKHRRHDPQLSFPEQIDRLNARLQDIEERRAEEADELRELREQEKDYRQRVLKLDAREDAMFREIDAIRAKARRRERHEMEKAAHSVRVRAIKALGAMIGQAEKQAKLGKPALLRLILRSTR